MSAAKPMRPFDRNMAYVRTNHGSLLFTPAQSRRFIKKFRRYLKYVALKNQEGGGEE